MRWSASSRHRENLACHIHAPTPSTTATSADLGTARPIRSSRARCWHRASDRRNNGLPRKLVCTGLRPDPVRHKDSSVDRPETRYAPSDDLMIAYQVTGEGNPVDLVLAPGVVSHLDLDWEDPEYARWIEQVSLYCRFIRFDKRGTGLSDRGVYAATLEERTDDIRAVMDAAGSERAVIFGISEGGCMACVFAATYPGRTRGLLLWGTMPRWVRVEDFPWGFERAEHARIVNELAEKGMTVEYLTGKGAGMTHASEGQLADAIRYCRASASPTQMAALERMNQDMDIRDILPTIGVPTLILNRTGDPVAPIEAVRYMASRIPDARLIEFPGRHARVVCWPARRRDQRCDSGVRDR
jgi:pimeloyl-ACP methyl ester carboxylesterase